MLNWGHLQDGEWWELVAAKPECAERVLEFAVYG